MDGDTRYWISVVLLVLSVAVVTGLVIEWRQWRAGRRLMNRRHFGLRVFTGLLLLGILGMILFGVLWLPQYRPLQVMVYWAICLLLVFVLMALALLDWRWVMERQVEQEWSITRQLLEQYGPGAGREPSPAGSNAPGGEACDGDR